jgi:hypothetical protein
MPGSPPALQAAYEYIRRTNRREFDKIGELFSKDALYCGPRGVVLHGRQAIGDFYASNHPNLAPTAWIVTTVTEGDSCVFEIEYRLDGAAIDDVGAVIDHFTVDDDGLVKRFVVYVRPSASAES